MGPRVGRFGPIVMLVRHSAIHAPVKNPPITALLRRHQAGDHEAFAEVSDLVYHELRALARQKLGQASDEVQRLEQDVGGPIAKRVLEFVNHQPVAVAAETLTRNGRARHIAAQALQLLAIAGLAGDGRNEREAVTRSGEWPRRLAPRPVERGSRGVQAKRLASCDWADGNPVPHGGALELRERILTSGVEVEPELLLVVALLHNLPTRPVDSGHA